ncbi:MAG: protein-(glutamine-N5) methyltransferase, release factor-specific [Flavobacteriales bacterium]|nr:protein-(glutamine-N5) methyltransferase, release factor-specific [Flavobacteriales bacterium]
MQKLGDIILFFKNELAGISNSREIFNWAYITINNLFGYDRANFIINQNQKISLHQRKKIKRIVSQLKKNKPIQYILEECVFFDLKFKVNSSVLIPRPETEELVKWILKDEFKSMIDIGTGSGCIAISIAKNKNVNVHAIDISNTSIKLAKKNAEFHGVSINFLNIDILTENISNKVDIVVSNPPYVLKKEKKHMNKNVIDYEPEIAIFVDDNNPFIFYKIIAKKAKKILNRNGKIYFEINENYSEEVMKILKDYGYVNIKLKKDINDRDRMIKATLK